MRAPRISRQRLLPKPISESPLSSIRPARTVAPAPVSPTRDRAVTLLPDPDSPTIERKDGRDETGQPYVRRYAKLPRAVHLAEAADVDVPRDTTVMFQRIVHDGLLGQQFLRRYVVTFDLPRRALIFAAPAAGATGERSSP